MDSFSIFIASGLIVTAVMLFSTLLWLRITKQLPKSQKGAGYVFAFCFELYAVGQSIALLTAVEMLSRSWWDVPSYCYGLAALLFGVGSYMFYKGQK